MRLVSGSDDKTLKVWDADTGSPISSPAQAAQPLESNLDPKPMNDAPSSIETALAEPVAAAEIKPSPDPRDSNANPPTRTTPIVWTLTIYVGLILLTAASSSLRRKRSA